MNKKDLRKTSYGMLKDYMGDIPKRKLSESREKLIAEQTGYKDGLAAGVDLIRGSEVEGLRDALDQITEYLDEVDKDNVFSFIRSIVSVNLHFTDPNILQ